MDDRATREGHASAILLALPSLVESGGDILAVLRGEMERMLLGQQRYGALDLDEPHDWDAEEDDEQMDVAVYRAFKRERRRRLAGQVTRSAARRRTSKRDI